jgi:hypothetical protein
MREIEDNRVFFISAVIFAVILSSLVVWQYFDEGDVVLSLGTVISGVWFFVLCGMGVVQMYWDKTRKISALLATLAVTRNQIFMARIAAGILAVLASFLPVIITMAVMPSVIESTIPIRREMTLEIWIPVFLFCFASYCIGLQVGWTSNKSPTLGALGLSLILIPIILIKGFGWDIYAILISFIAACLIRAWFKFSRSAF